MKPSNVRLEFPFGVTCLAILGSLLTKIRWRIETILHKLQKIQQQLGREGYCWNPKWKYSWVTRANSKNEPKMLPLLVEPQQWATKINPSGKNSQNGNASGALWKFPPLRYRVLRLISVAHCRLIPEETGFWPHWWFRANSEGFARAVFAFHWFLASSIVLRRE